MPDGNEALLQAALENAPLGFWVRDRDGKLVIQNPASLRQWGEMGPKLAEGDSTGSATLAFWAGIRGGVLEQEVASGHGRKRRFYHTIIAPYTAQGELRGVLGFDVDITERKRAEMRNRLLADIASYLLRADRPQEAIKPLCEQIARFLECEVFASGLFDETKHLRIHASKGFPPELWGQFELEELRRVDSRESGSSQIYLKDLRSGNGEPAIAILRAAGLQAYVCHPLVAKGRVLGTLSFGTRNRAIFQSDELVIMQTVSDLMAIAVERQQATAELRGLNAELEQRVKERTRSLQEATDQLNSFCHTVAHDLRAPLRAQQDFSELLLREYGPSLGPAGQDFARRINEAARRQGELVRDLLAHAKLSHSSLPIEDVNLRQAFSRVLSDLRLEIKDAGAVIESSQLDGTVTANAPSIHVILQNLTSNALKFVKPGTVPRVEVWSERRAGRVRICVRDHGIGIDPVQSSKLFEVFQRFAGKQYPGTGLGLALVRKAAERMGGKVGVESQLGQGSLFWVDLQAD